MAASMSRFDRRRGRQRRGEDQAVTEAVKKLRSIHRSGSSCFGSYSAWRSGHDDRAITLPKTHRGGSLRASSCPWAFFFFISY
jgi:hypothetical protein